METDGVTHEELIGALTAAGFTGSSDDPGMTSKELAKAWNCSVVLVTKRLQLAKAAGFLKTGRAMRTRIDGLNTPVSVYSFVFPKTKGGKKR